MSATHYEPIKFCSTKEEMLAVNAIAKRGMALLKSLDLPLPTMLDLTMDIEAAHCNGCPLDLAKFLAFDDANFSHDLGGIRRHINRETGELGDCFLPRCAR